MLEDIELKKNKVYKEYLTNEIDSILLAMGKDVFQMISEKKEDRDSLIEKYNLILEKKQEIDILENNIEEEKLETSSNKEEKVVKNHLVCPNCGEIYSDSVHFCKKCGCDIPVSTIVNKPKEVSETKNSQDQYVCPNCQKVYTKPVRFCKFCGAKMFEEEKSLQRVETDFSEAKIDDYVCPNCGAHFDKKTNFCRECGCKMDI